MTNQQLTILTGNSAGDLGGVIAQLSDEGVDIRAHCLVDNGHGNCKLRMVVSEPDRAVEILQKKRIAAVVNDVVIVETDDEPGALSRLLKILDQDEIRIEYSYTAASILSGIAVMVFRFSENEKAAARMEENGFKLLKAKTWHSPPH